MPIGAKVAHRNIVLQKSHTTYATVTFSIMWSHVKLCK